jgi:hypothetical protein
MVVASAAGVIERRHVNLAGSGSPRTVQPYHAARRLDLAEAEQEVERAASRARKLAGDAIRQAMGQTALSRPPGPPWREDEKLATAAALIALALA